MATAPDGRDLLPVACTLGSADGAERVGDWRRIITEAGLGTEPSSGRITLRFRDAPEVSAELTRLVDAERDCCAFLGWNLTNEDGELRVGITGTDDELRSLSFG